MNVIKIKLAIKFSYTGTLFHGSALQKSNNNTVSQHIINALQKTKIYLEDPVFAGRTDKNVSAKNMVASFYVIRINGMDYSKVIQDRLPIGIVLNSYAFVNDDFDARHDCIMRHYKYFFFENYDLERMNFCCEKLLEVENFRSLCKRSKEKNCRKQNLILKDDFYNRKLISLKIIKEKKINILDIKGRSFLHNMVRKIFWVVENYSDGKIDDKFFEKIENGTAECGIANPENLIFCCAEYSCKIEWIYIENNSKKHIESVKKLQLEIELQNFKLS
ncbi:pseudouridine synthase deg1 [Gurleya vavrai]